MAWPVAPRIEARYFTNHVQMFPRPEDVDLEVSESTAAMADKQSSSRAGSTPAAANGMSRLDLSRGKNLATVTKRAKKLRERQ